MHERTQKFLLCAQDCQRLSQEHSFGVCDAFTFVFILPYINYVDVESKKPYAHH